MSQELLEDRAVLGYHGGVTQQRSFAELDVDSAFDDPDDGWFGFVREADLASPHDVTDHIEPHRESDLPEVAVTEIEHVEYADPWPTPSDDVVPTPEVAEVTPDDVREQRPADEAEAPRWVGALGPASFDAPATASTTVVAGSRPGGSAEWSFKSADSAPWYWSAAAKAALIVAAVAAVAAVIVGAVLLMRSPDAGVEQPTVVAPNASTVPPASSSAPALTMASDAPLPPGPPPVPPPPPPPSADQMVPPVVSRNYTPQWQNTPAQSAKPEIGVTRTPVTRAPLSATPPPPPAPDRNSGTPGDGRKHRGFW